MNSTTHSPGGTCDEDDYITKLINTTNQIQYFACPTLVVLGLLGNVCTILTVSQSQFRHMTSRHILCSLAVSDSLLLCTNPFNQHFMKDLWHQDVRALSTFGCKLFFAMYRVGKISASWFIVLVAVERFLAVIFPLRAKAVLQKKTVFISIATVYIIVFSVAGVWSFSTGIVDNVCIPDMVTAGTQQFHSLLVLIGACLYSLVPMTILLTLTPPIVIKLLRNHRQRLRMHHSAILRSARETSRISIMLIGIATAYIIWVTPITIVLIITFWTKKPIFGSDNSSMIILQTVALTFEQLNHSCNFFIYILCSFQFRRKFCLMIGCKSVVRHEPSSNSISVLFCN